MGTGTAGAGILGNAQNADGVYGSTTNGTGVRGSANGTGTGGYFNSGASGHSLITNGPLKLTSIGEGVGKVLTSDAAGNATWQTLATGSSTWVTTGTNISNTNTGNVGIGTTDPGTILTVKYNGQGFSQESINGSVEAGFYVDDAAAYVQTHTNTNLNFTTNNGLSQMTLQKGTPFTLHPTPYSFLFLLLLSLRYVLDKKYFTPATFFSYSICFSSTYQPACIFY